jgi:hypothetical protein
MSDHRIRSDVGIAAPPLVRSVDLARAQRDAEDLQRIHGVLPALLEQA